MTIRHTPHTCCITNRTSWISPTTCVFILLAVLSQSAWGVSLIEAYNGAFNNDLDYQASRFAWLRDQTSQGIALSDLLPSLNSQLATNSAKLKVVDGDTEFNLSNETLDITAHQVLFNLSTYQNYQAASAQSRQALLTYNLATQELIVRVAKLYTNLLLALDNLRFTLAEQAETEMRYNDVYQKVKAGIMTQTDLAETQAQLERIKAEVLSAKQQILQAQDSLADSTGLAIHSVDGLTDKKHASEKQLTPMNRWINTGLHNNLSIKIAQENFNTANAQKKSAQATYYPSLNGFASYQTNRYYGDDLSKASTNQLNLYDTDSSSIGASLTWPILNGGGRYYNNKKAQGNAQYFSTILAKSKQDTSRHIRTLYHDLEFGKQIIKANTQAVYYSAELVKMNRLKLEAGTTTMLEVLDNISNLRSDQQALAKSRYDYILNLLQLKLIAGTITADDIRDINNYFTQKTIIAKELAKNEQPPVKPQK